MPLTPVQKLSVTIGAALVVLVGFGAASYYYTARLVAADRAVEKANIHMSAALTLVAARQDGERVTKAYVVRPDSVTRTSLPAAQARAEDALDVLTRGTEDNPRQALAIQALARGVAESFGTFRTTLMLRDRIGADSARRQLSGDVSASTADSLMKIVTAIHDEELRVLAERTRLQSASGTNAQRVILLTMVLTLLLAGVALQPMRTEIATRLTSHIVREHTTGGSAMSDAARARASAATQLQALHHLSVALGSSGDPQDVARALVAAAAPLNAVLTAVIVPSGADHLVLLAASDAAFNRVTPGLSGPVREILRTGEAAMSESRKERDRLWGVQADLDALGAQGAVLLSPLMRGGAATGVLLIALATDRMFEDDDLNFAATLGRFGGQGLAPRSPQS